ncbi:MAG: ComEA family DNA-binding protein [Collinsella sp.]
MGWGRRLHAPSSRIATRNGPFSTIEDLMRVSGIGEKKFEKLKSSIYV